MPKISVAEGPTNAADPQPADQPERADRTYAPASIDTLAEGAYCAYANAREWYAYDGSDLPEWDDVESEIQDAWKAAVRDTRTRILEPGGAQPPAQRPADDEPDPDSDPDTDDDGPTDDQGNVYPDNGSAADVESWVAGNTDRAAYALQRENDRPTGPRAGLSASLRKLAPDDGGPPRG